MKRILVALAALALPGAALAGSYRIVLDKPPTGRLIKGYGGLAAADERTPDTLVRVISPGNDVEEHGTVRVLVMNLGDKPFEFGPDQVSLRLADGTVLRPTSVDAMEKGRMLVERESQHAAAADLSNRNSLSSLAGQSAGRAATTPGVSVMDTGSVTHVGGQDPRSDAMMLPGGRLLDAIYQVLVPLTVGPKQTWGGYYVFDVPREVRKRRADQPLTITVRTGNEQHSFSARLHRN